MAISSYNGGSGTLAPEVQTVYDADYLFQGQSRLYFDQFCDLRTTMDGQRGVTYQYPIIYSTQPNTTSLDELSDVPSQAVRAGTVSITLSEWGGAFEVTKFVVATSYSDPLQQIAYANGYNMAESFDNIVRAVAGKGSRSMLANNRTARSQFQGQQNTDDRLTAQFIEQLTMRARQVRMPFYEDDTVACVMPQECWYDLLQDSGIRSMSIHQHPEILFNGEMGYWSGMRMVVSANAKVFAGAGAAGAASLSTTLAAAASVGDTNVKATSVTNAAVGQVFTIQDGAETGNTWYDTNERVVVTSVGTAGAGGTGISFYPIDPGPQTTGNTDVGLRYAHANGTTFTNANSVYPIVVLGPNSLIKACSSLTGPYGETVVTGPFDRLGRFLTFGWYAIAGWAREQEGWLLRGEVGASY